MCFSLVSYKEFVSNKEYVLNLFAEVTTVTVGGVQTGDDNVFSASVATATTIPEHVLVSVVF